jgi:hypothetical protein
MNTKFPDEACAEANRRNKNIVFDALSNAGITHVLVGFDGEGDSGQIDGAASYAGDAAADFPATIVTLYRAPSGWDEFVLQEVTLRQAVEELCYDYLEQEHGGWENNDGAFGEFTFDVAERKVGLDFNARFTDYSHHSYTF